MGSYEALNLAHWGAAIALLLLALASIWVSVLIAVKPAADPANERLVARANGLGMVQYITIAILTVTGLIEMFLGSWSLSEFWLWSSLVVVVFYSAAMKYVTGPARMAVADGGSEGNVGLQVGLQVGHVLLLLVAFAAMLVKPV